MSHPSVKTVEGLQRSITSAVTSANQGDTEHCVAFAYADMLARKCAQIVEMSNNEISILYRFFLSRMVRCTHPKDPINLYFVNLLIHELNYGFGTIAQVDRDLYYVGDVLMSDLLPDQIFHRYKIVENIPFKPYNIDGRTLHLCRQVTDRLTRQNAQIDFKYLETVAINRSANYLQVLKDFIADNVCTISIRFTDDGENVEKLENVAPNGLIDFDVREGLKRKNIAAHAMQVRRVVPFQVGTTKYVDTLELFNSWGEDWGVKAKTKTGRDIKVGYFKIDNEIIQWYIDFVCYLDIVERDRVLTVGKDSMFISPIDKPMGLGINRKSKQKRKQKKSKNQRKRRNTRKK